MDHRSGAAAGLNAALRRIGNLTDGWVSYVVTADMFRQRLDRRDRGLGTAHLLFTRFENTYEKALDAATLSQPAIRDGLSQGCQCYCELGRAAQVVKVSVNFMKREDHSTEDWKPKSNVLRFLRM